MLFFVRSAEFTKPPRILIRSIGAALAVFSLAQVMPLSVDLGTLSTSQRIAIYVLPAASVVAGIAGWFRPAFYIIPICACSWYRFAFATAVGFPVAWGEEMTLQESALFLLSGSLLIALLARASLATREQSGAAFSALVMGACAIHFGNYLFAGVAKLRLDGGWMDWITTNPTYLLLASADGIGTYIFSGTKLAQKLYALFRDNILFMNIVTVGTQLAAVLAIPFVSVSRIALIIYDFFHVSIAVLTGIFFYLWIAMNVAFTVALAYVSTAFGWVARLTFVLITLLSNRAFTIFEAGWYETHAYNLLTLNAVTNDGAEVRMSPRAFGLISYYLYSDYALDAEWRVKNALPSLFYGTAYNSAVRRDAERCIIAGDAPLKIAPLVQAAVQKLHPAVVSPGRPWPGLLKFPPYHFLEHGPTFAAGNQIDAGSIVAYRFRWEARCIEETPTGFAQRILKAGSLTAPVTK